MKRGELLAGAAAAAAGASFGIHRIVDPDLPQQIAVGRAILADFGSLGTSSFTFTYPGYPYVEDKWLASVAAALVDRIGGVDALMVWQTALPAIAAAAWYAMFRAFGAGRAVSVAAVAAALLADAFRLEPRPDTLSHALVALTLALLVSTWPLRRALVACAVLMALWVNLHGYFVNGWLILVAGGAAAISGDRRIVFAPGSRGRIAARTGGMLAVAVAACLLHPQGWRATIWPIRQLLELRSSPVLRSSLTEFEPSASLFAGGGAWMGGACLAAVVLGLALFPLRPRRPVRLAAAAAAGLGVLAASTATAVALPYSFTLALWAAAAVEAPSAFREGRRLEAIVFAGFSVLAYPMIRNLALVPPAALLLLVSTGNAAPSATARRLHGGLAAVALLAVVAIRLSDLVPPGTYRAPGRTGWGWDESRFPVGAAEFVDRAGIRGRILNNFDGSGWLLRRWHPARSVFICDNTSMYPSSFLETYRGEIMAGKRDPEELHARYGVEVAILDHAAMETPALVGRLARSPEWRLVYVDRAAAVWTRAGEAPAVDLARRRAELVPDAVDERHVFPSLNFGIFLRASGRPDLALEEADRLWRRAADPAIATFSAAAWEESGKLGDAVPRLEEAVARFGEKRSLGSWLARALFFRGVGRADAGDPRGARSDLERSLSLAPREPGTLVALARLDVAEGREESARERLRLAIEGGGDDLRRLVASDPALAPLVPPAR